MKYVAIITTKGIKSDIAELDSMVGFAEAEAETPEALIEMVAEKLGLTVIVTSGNTESGAV